MQGAASSMLAKAEAIPTLTTAAKTTLKTADFCLQEIEGLRYSISPPSDVPTMSGAYTPIPAPPPAENLRDLLYDIDVRLQTLAQKLTSMRSIV